MGEALDLPSDDGSALRAVCARCARVVSLHGTPRIAASGKVELFCEPCWPRRDEPLTVRAVAIEPPPPPPSRHGFATRVLIGCGVAGGLAIALGSADGARAPASVSANVIDEAPAPAAAPAGRAARMPSLSGRPDTRPVGGDPGDVGDVGGEGAEHGGAAVAAPVAAPPGAAPSIEIPLRDDEPIDEWYPTLADWTHPVAASVELVPHSGSRRFGARRDGVGRLDCGAGHCGVDLDGPRGQPIVAVAWGVVARIQPSASGRGGKYVRIEHPDGIFTSYMHLDDIAPDLALGDEIDAGTIVGTLGRTGIQHSSPHLHFSLEIPAEDAEETWTYIDPVPFLARASVIELDEVIGAVPESTAVTVEAEADEAVEAVVEPIAPLGADAVPALPIDQIAAPMNAPR